MLPADVNQKIEKGPALGCRHIQTFLYFLLMMYSYCMRSVLSVAIVAMNDNSTTNPDIPVYNWTDQSIVLSAFFWGYIIFQIPAAFFGKRYGIKWILIGSTIVDSMSCIMIPTMAYQFGSKGVMGCRFLQGLSQGFLLPSVHTLLGQWAPAEERSRMGTFAYAGSVFGNIVSMPLTGYICSTYQGWPFSFYLWGACGLSWSCLWAIFGFEKPSTHRNISENEVEYIKNSLGDLNLKLTIPWRKILTSLPVWALFVANLAVNWGSSVLLTQTPTYLNKVLRYDITSNAMLSASPYLAMWLMSFVFSYTCDFIINKGWTSLGTARKIFQGIGSMCPAVGLMCLGFIDPSHVHYSIAMLIFVGGAIGAGYCGFQVNHIDLSPVHSGMLMALSNGVSSVFSVISPLIVQFVVVDQENQGQWRIIFMVSALIYAASSVFFTMFASGEVQDWNDEIKPTH